MEKHKLLNEQKSIFGNKMIKVALSLRMRAKAYIRKHIFTYTARVSEA